MNNWKKLATTGLGAVVLTVGAVQSAVIKTYKAQDIEGQLSPPNYALRLDGFFDNNTDSEPIFSFNNVRFDVNDDGSARLHGDITLAEANGPEGAADWMLDVALTQVADPVGHPNPDWDFYELNTTIPLTAQLINKANPTDFTFLWGQANDLGSVFQVGAGANEKNTNYGASGWVNYHHIVNGVLIAGGGPAQHMYASDFIMDLEPIPEPATLGLLGLGLSAFALLGWRRRARS